MLRFTFLYFCKYSSEPETNQPNNIAPTFSSSKHLQSHLLSAPLSNYHSIIIIFIITLITIIIVASSSSTDNAFFECSLDMNVFLNICTMIHQLNTINTIIVTIMIKNAIQRRLLSIQSQSDCCNVWLLATKWNTHRMVAS